ncbi:hypothetical protein NDU88_005765 [Pleurodeles waltl]|uniref:Uncharacterized protein n=1 Tax=Pleurodeles waltl TaxID=8319 RepID=A0AAV7VMM9_PLEWA|nr:hypothetical protein NDU88_005765 [Pleurodeles waltl]
MRSAVGMLPTTRVVVAPVFDLRINSFSALTSLHRVPGSQHNFGNEEFILLEPLRNLREPSVYLPVSVYKAEDFLCQKAAILQSLDTKVVFSFFFLLRLDTNLHEPALRPTST